MNYAEIRWHSESIQPSGKNRTKSKHRRIQITRLRERDGGNCWICEQPIDFSLPREHDEAASVDHVHPFADGGSNHISNLRLAHRCCNENRGNPRIR